MTATPTATDIGTATTGGAASGPTRLGRPALTVHVEVFAAEALTQDLVDRVGAACRRAEDVGATALVARLHGAATTTARDRSDWPGTVDVTQVNRWERAVRRLERLPLATVAVADAECRGPAAELLLAADYRIAADDLRLSLGGPAGPASAWPGMAVFRLAAQVGGARARQIVLHGAPVTAARALELGLLDELHGVEHVDARVAAAVDLLAALPGPELAIRRRLVGDAGVLSFEDAFGSHLAACDRALRHSRPDPAP